MKALGRKTRSPDAEVQHRLVWTVESLLETSTQTVKVQHPNRDPQPLPSARDVGVLISRDAADVMRGRNCGKFHTVVMYVGRGAWGCLRV